jgi:glycosyltransferase involved in cell wall biosynthesis
VKRRPRIGILANTIDTEYGLRTGGHLHFIESAKRMTDWDVVVFVPSYAAREIAPLIPSARIVAFPTARRFTESKLPLFAASLVTWVTKIGELRACDVLYASSHFLGDTIPATLLRGRRSVVVIHHILDSPFQRPGGLLQNLIAYATERLSLWLIRFRAGTLAFDNSLLAKELGARRFLNAKIVSGNAVEVPAANGEMIREHDVVFVGRLSPTKGVDDLLRAWRRIVDAVPDAHLHVIGEGTRAYEAQLRGIVRDLAIDASVSFLGRASDAVKFERLRSSGIFAFPSKEEGWGIALAEAMACGLPCVTYELPPYAEVFPQGRVSVAVGDVEGFARSVIALLRDSVARRELASSAAELGRHFTWDRVAKIECEAIAALLSDGEVGTNRRAR